MQEISWTEVDVNHCYLAEVDGFWRMLIKIDGRQWIVDFEHPYFCNKFADRQDAEYWLEHIEGIFLGNHIDPEVQERMRSLAAFTPEPVAPPEEPVPAIISLLPDNDPALEDVNLVLDLIDEWLRRRSAIGKHCICNACRNLAEGVLPSIEARYAPAVPEELMGDIKRARKIIRGEVSVESVSKKLPASAFRNRPGHIV